MLATLAAKLGPAPSRGIGATQRLTGGRACRKETSFWRGKYQKKNREEFLVEREWKICAQKSGIHTKRMCGGKSSPLSPNGENESRQSEDFRIRRKYRESGDSITENCNDKTPQNHNPFKKYKKIEKLTKNLHPRDLCFLEYLEKYQVQHPHYCANENICGKK